MRPDAAAADRNHAVRTAVRGWTAIDAATLTRIDALYPDDRSRSRPVFRTLLFAFALLASAAAAGLAFTIFTSPWAVVLMGAVLLAATEVQVASWRRADGGAEAATALLGVLLLVIGAALVLERSYHPGELVLARSALALAAVVCWLAAARWGLPFLAVLGCIACAALLATLTGGRALWLVAAVATVPPLLRGTTARRLPPALRTACAGALVTALGAAYLAVNLWSLDGGWIEQLGEHARETDTPVRVMAALATALAPLLVLGLGAARRRRLLLWAGAAMTAASLVTLRHFAPLGPLWLWLAAAGALCVGAALAVRRALAAPAGGERWGFTAMPEGGERRLEAAATTAAAMAVLTPEARPTEPEPPFKPGGGGFGGGGASDSY